MEFLTIIIIIAVFVICYHLLIDVDYDNNKFETEQINEIFFEHYANSESNGSNNNKKHKSILLNPNIKFNQHSQYSDKAKDARKYMGGFVTQEKDTNKPISHVDPRPIPLINPLIMQIPIMLPVQQIANQHSVEKLKMLQCILAIHEIFEQNKLWYIITFETLQNSVLTGNLSAFTKSADMFIKFEEIEFIKKILPTFESLGYKVNITLESIEIYLDDKHHINLYPIKEEENGVISRCTIGFGNCVHPEKRFDGLNNLFSFSSDLIKKRKQHYLNPILVWGPYNAVSLIQHWNSSNLKE